MTHRSDVLSKAVDEQAEELLEFLAVTVRCRSVSGDERTVGELYAAWMERAGWSVERQALAASPLAAGEDAGDRVNVIGRPPSNAGNRAVLVLTGTSTSYRLAHLSSGPPRRSQANGARGMCTGAALST